MIENPEQIVEAVLDELSNRRGFRQVMDGMDDDVMEELKCELVNRVLAAGEDA